MAITPDDVLNTIADEVPVERSRLDPNATLDSLNIASLDMISVMFALEDRFGVVVEQTDLKDARTLQDFVDVVMAKSQAASD